MEHTRHRKLMEQMMLWMSSRGYLTEFLIQAIASTFPDEQAPSNAEVVDYLGMIQLGIAKRLRDETMIWDGLLSGGPVGEDRINMMDEIEHLASDKPTNGEYVATLIGLLGQDTVPAQDILQEIDAFLRSEGLVTEQNGTTAFHPGDTVKINVGKIVTLTGISGTHVDWKDEDGLTYSCPKGWVKKA